MKTENLSLLDLYYDGLRDHKFSNKSNLSFSGFEYLPVASWIFNESLTLCSVDRGPQSISAPGKQPMAGVTLESGQSLAILSAQSVQVSIGALQIDDTWPGWDIDSTRHDIDYATKRLLDIIGALLILLALSPILVIAAALVRATSPGPALFRQARYGRHGRVFTIYKFRTMTGAPRDSAAIGDPLDHAARTTRVGHVLRRYCIDELPQLFNVVLGDMSLVGPRAHPVDLHVLGVPYESVVPNYHTRHGVQPGMTGLAQVLGYCGIVDSIEHARARVANDILYISGRSVALDFALIVYTAWRFLIRGGRGRGTFPSAWFIADARIAERAAT